MPRTSRHARASAPIGAALLALAALLAWGPTVASAQPPAARHDPVPKAPAHRPTSPPSAATAPKPAPAPGPVGPPAPAPRPATVPVPPMVISRDKLSQKKGGSDFLRLPGADRYDPDGGDWSAIPPWRQTSFFGIRARGQFFVYVVDCSGSMVDEGRLARAKIELRRAIQTLQEPQRFQVIFYNDQAIPMPGGLPRSADLTGKSQLAEWLRLIEPDGETDPRPALGMGLGLRPDAIFLLSDGEYPDNTVEAVAKMNRRRIPIHCIDLSGGEAGDQLRRIAADSGGRFVARPWAGP